MPDAAQSAIALRGLTIRYGSLAAVDDVTLDVPAGEITGLLGRNGAGKSTTIRALAGLLEPDAGTVMLLGGHYPGDASAIRARTGFLLSEPALFAYLNAEETLRFLGEAYGQPRAEARRRAAELIDFLELRDAEDQLAANYSTGMAKRLALAAALVHDTDLLVLDEPFESLDPLTVRRVKTLLVGYAKRGGTVLLSSHLIATLEEICDRVAILERGRLVLEGSLPAVRSRLADRLPASSLEEIYASVVSERGGRAPSWLVPGRGG